MNTTEALEQFRSDMNDVEEPQLWSDLEVFRYMDDAQKMFCRLTGGLGDVSSSVTRLTITSADVLVRTHASILTIYDAYDVDTGRKIEVLNYKDLGRTGLRLTSTPGATRAIVIGMEPHKVRPYPLLAGEDITIQMVIDRMPLEPIVEVEQDFEVDEQHHLHLLMWMKYLAYSKQDAETFDRSKAADFKEAFGAYCFEAKAEKERAMYKPRNIQYGGV